MDQLDNLQQLSEWNLRVFLADIVSKDFSIERLEDRMKELENLVKTYGWLVLVQTYQKKETPDANTYVGKWKMEEIITQMKETWCNLLIIGNILKPSQIYKINELLRPIWAKARDRVDLILKIFDKHAVGMEARLQIELAAIKHMWPRIFGMGMELSKQWWSGAGGAWAMRWLGETNTERMKRHLREKEAKIQKKLKEFEQMRKLHREWRQRKWLVTVGIVGYTNAGKSSLLNSLTNKWVLAENKLFATLWTHVGKIFIMTDSEKWTGREILLNDTIWFIRDLPPQLIKAFSSTLEDSIEADYLLHIIDCSDPFVGEKIKVVNDILDKIGARQERILVFNKIDLTTKEVIKKLQEEYKGEEQVWISIKEWEWIAEIKEKIKERLK